MPKEPNVALRGAIVIAIPSLLQLFLSVLLIVQVVDAQRLSEQVFEEKQKLWLTMQLGLVYLSATDAALMYQVSGGQNHQQDYWRQKKTAEDLLDRLVHKLSGGPAQRISDKIVVQQKKLWEVLGDLTNIEPKATAVLMMHLAPMHNSNNHLSKTLRYFNAQEMESVRHISEQLERTQGRVLTLLFCNCLSGTLVAFAICFFFNRLFAKRLMIMVDNTSRVTGGRPLKALVGGQDEIAALDQAMHTMNDSLIAAQSFRQEVVTMLGHDLRSPLTGVALVLEQIEEGTYAELTESERTKVAGTRSSITSLVAMVSDLLDAEKMRAGKLEIHLQPLDMATVVENCIAPLEPLAASRRVKLLAQSQGIMKVNADPARIAQVVNNLLSNAIKFSPDQGLITITLEKQESSCLVRVQDEGPGVSPESGQEIFGRFEQAQDQPAIPIKGSGLGLSIAKSIVEAHGGQIGVTSGSLAGSCFWFTLPLALDSSA